MACSCGWNGENIEPPGRGTVFCGRCGAPKYRKRIGVGVAPRSPEALAEVSNQDLVRQWASACMWGPEAEVEAITAELLRRGIR